MDRRQFFRASLATAAAAAVPRIAFSAVAPAEMPAQIPAVTSDGAATAIDRAALTQLRDSLRGALLLPGDTGYDKARRVLNETVDRHPALVVQPTGVADVRTTVDFAREHKLLLAVKCGGHSQGGKSTCDGGLQVDLSRLRYARVDPVARTANVAGGSLLGDLDHEAMAFGLVTTAGTVSHTGVGGLTLGAGFGRLARRFGLSLDNLRSVDIVTADGSYRHASAHDNQDLFWGVRGGGGNFGIVTNFEFGLHPMQRQVIGGSLVFPISRARDLLRFYGEYCTAAPDELYLDPVLAGPPSGDAMFIFSLCYSGATADAERVLAPLRKLGTPLRDTIKAIDYVALQRRSDNTDPRSEASYIRSGFVDAFPAGFVDALVDGFRPDPGRNTLAFFQHSGGAIGRVAADATAFPHRRSIANLLVNISWPIANDGQAHVRYADDWWSRLGRYTDGFYTNEVVDESQKVVDDNYQGNLARLRQLKKKYDPGNLFRLNANIRPA